MIYSIRHPEALSEAQVSTPSWAMSVGTPVLRVVLALRSGVLPYPQLGLVVHDKRTGLAGLSHHETVSKDPRESHAHRRC